MESRVSIQCKKEGLLSWFRLPILGLESERQQSTTQIDKKWGGVHFVYERGGILSWFFLPQSPTSSMWFPPRWPSATPPCCLQIPQPFSTRPPPWSLSSKSPSLHGVRPMALWLLSYPNFHLCRIDTQPKHLVLDPTRKELVPNTFS